MIKQAARQFVPEGIVIFNDGMKALVLFISALCIVGSPPATKKEQLLLLSKKYFPENYAVLKAYDDETINGQAQGDSLKEFISDVSTIVHEGYHHYHGMHSSYYEAAVVYRINDTLSFSVKNFKTFPSREINNIVPAATRKKIFRYDTYINSNEKYLVTQQFGILGLLEECIAYYQSFHTALSIFHYYKDQYGWKNPDAWITYLGDIASYRYSLLEFELFISWYMQYAKKKYPVTYREITGNAGLKKLFVFLDRENTRLTALYDQQRSFILKQLEGQLQVSGNFILNMTSLHGKGIFDQELAQMTALLKMREHLILNELRK